MAKLSDRAMLWSLIWSLDRRRALRACDAIVRERPVPDSLLARLRAPEPEPTHGTHYAYTILGCHCATCKRGNADRELERLHRRRGERDD